MENQANIEKFNEEVEKLHNQYSDINWRRHLKEYVRIDKNGELDVDNWVKDRHPHVYNRILTFFESLMNR
jgi:hypothetical protein